MSRYLALDTATDRPTLALGTPASPGPDLALADRHDLSRDIDRLTRELLAARGLAPEDLAAIVVGDGPGSFTGLRIGIAFAKGLARALDVPLLVAPSLLGAARRRAGDAAREARPITVVAEYDALRGDVFRAVYRFGSGRVEVLEPPALARPDTPQPPAAAAALRAGPGDASAAALLALVGLAGGPAPLADPAAWEPDYGRPAEAEARRRARDGAAR